LGKFPSSGHGERAYKLAWACKATDALDILEEKMLTRVSEVDGGKASDAGAECLEFFERSKIFLCQGIEVSDYSNVGGNV